MQSPNKLIQSSGTFLLGISIGVLLSISIPYTQPSAISSHESEVQKAIDLLADLSNGQENLAKVRLDVDLRLALKEINALAKEKSPTGERARVVQKVVTKWRADNPGLSLSAELSKEIQIASIQNQ